MTRFVDPHWPPADDGPPDDPGDRLRRYRDAIDLPEPIRGFKEVSRMVLDEWIRHGCPTDEDYCGVLSAALAELDRARGAYDASRPQSMRPPPDIEAVLAGPHGRAEGRNKN